MPLSLKNTRHQPTAPHMLAENTEETLVLLERWSYRQPAGWQWCPQGIDETADQAPLMMDTPLPEPQYPLERGRIPSET